MFGNCPARHCGQPCRVVRYWSTNTSTAPSPLATVPIHWLDSPPLANRSKHRFHGAPGRGRLPEERRLPLRPAPPFGLRWGSVPADAPPETQKGEHGNNPIADFDFEFNDEEKL